MTAGAALHARRAARRPRAPGPPARDLGPTAPRAQGLSPPPAIAAQTGADLCSNEQTGVCSSAAVAPFGTLEETRVRVSPPVRTRPELACGPLRVRAPL